MSRKILILDGHPDPDAARLIHGLAESYGFGAREAGHAVKILRIADLQIPPLQSRAEQISVPSSKIRDCQNDLAWADHVVVLFPLWLGDMPSALKAWFEQILRPDFAFSKNPKKPFDGQLRGKSARIVVTMGMPSWFYQLWYGAHCVKSMKRNILHFTGIKPVAITYLGRVEAVDANTIQSWLDRMRTLGAKAA